MIQDVEIWKLITCVFQLMANMLTLPNVNICRQICDFRILTSVRKYVIRTKLRLSVRKYVIRTKLRLETYVGCK